jgi:hypothetical protein
MPSMTVRVALALTLQLGMVLLLAVCCRIHRASHDAMLAAAAPPLLADASHDAESSSGLEHAHRSVDAAWWIRSAPAPLRAPLRSVWARVALPGRRLRHSLLSTAFQLTLWHSDMVPLLACLAAGLHSIDLLHAVSCSPDSNRTRKALPC